MTRPSTAVVCLLFLASCGHAAPGVSSGTGLPDSGEFVAYASDFAGYHDWSRVDVTDDGGAGGVAHLAGQFAEYINVPPPPVADPFPVGTLVVKQSEQGGTPGQGQSDNLMAGQGFAMAKRGGDYNSGGASGWEWFELQSLSGAGDQVEILWRGTAPPAGQTYSGKVNGDCNHCHALAPHDGVFAQ